MSRYAPKPTLTILSNVYSRDKKPWDRVQQKLTDIDLTDEYFQKDGTGLYRWIFMRAAYMNGYIGIDRVIDLMHKWRDQKEYLWLEAIDKNTKEVKGNFFFKCAKRGNDVYKSRLSKRFSFLDSLDPIYFFLDDDKTKYSPMLFITTTVDPKKYPDIDKAWVAISQELHLFESKLRQEYGSFVKFRVWEANGKGYPHCHVVYYFNDKWFKAIPHIRKKDKKLIYIVPKTHRDTISKFWSMGNVDVQAVQDTHGAFSEVKKYITKNIWNEKGDLTNAYIGLFNKQMYSLSRCDPYKKRFQYWQKHGIKDWHDQERTFMSSLSKWAKKDFIGAIWGAQIYFQFYKELCGGLAEPGTAALVKEFLHNCNNEELEFRFVGCVSAMDLCDFGIDCGDDWLLAADPPSEMKFILGLGRDELKLNRG
jgi:hypothetical protein